MGLFGKKERPTTPIIVPDPRRPSHFFILRSPEVAITILAMFVSYYLLMTATRNDHFEGKNGLWQTFNRKSRARMQSREAQLQPEPPTAISADMVLIFVCIMAANAFLNACVRVLRKEQRHVETVESAAWLKEAENPETRSAALAKNANKLAERIKVWEENDKRRAEGRPLKRERLVELDVMADEVLTNIIVVAAVVLSLLTGYYVQMQAPNQVRGSGAAGMLTVLVGGLVVCGTDRALSGLQHYCNYVNIICMTAFLVFITRATLLAS